MALRSLETVVIYSSKWGRDVECNWEVQKCIWQNRDNIGDLQTYAMNIPEEGPEDTPLFEAEKNALWREALKYLVMMHFIIWKLILKMPLNWEPSSKWSWENGKWYHFAVKGKVDVHCSSRLGVESRVPGTVETCRNQYSKEWRQCRANQSIIWVL